MEMNGAMGLRISVTLATRSAISSGDDVQKLIPDHFLHALDLLVAAYYSITPFGPGWAPMAVIG